MRVLDRLPQQTPLKIDGKILRTGSRGCAGRGSATSPTGCARWTLRRRPRPSPCWKRSASCAATARSGRPASCGRIRGGAGCCAPNPITASGRRRCCSTCGTRSAPDVWLARSHRYGDIRKALLSAPAVADADRSLPVPASPRDWLAERRFAPGAVAGGSIEDSVLPRREDGNRRAERGRRPGRRPLPAAARGADRSRARLASSRRRRRRASTSSSR